MKINFFTKNYFFPGLILFIISGSFLYGHFVSASALGVSIAQILGHVIEAIISALGVILTGLMGILIRICSYNDFIVSPAVTNGWIIVRDLCNMFFILILLVVAFATILRIESYQWKKILPKLLIMAVLINFSKTICGLIIDFAQVIMLTFVNGFREAAAGNLTTMLGIDKIMQIDATNARDVDGFSIFGSYMLALIYVLISLVVVTVIIAVLVMRMVMLWVYIVLSPLAYLLAAFPAGQKYSQQWWGEFSKNVIVGPVLAFFIWLSFVSATSGLISGLPPAGTGDAIAAITQAGSSDNMIKFIISIGMLIGGLMVTQSMGGMAASIAGKGMAGIQKGGALMAKAPLLGAKTALGYGVDKLHEGTGVDINVGRVWNGIQEKRKDIQAKRYGRGMDKAAQVMQERGRLYGALAMTGTPGSAWEQLTTAKGWAQRFRGGKNAQEKITDINTQRKQQEDALETAENNERYIKAKEISEAATPIERLDLQNENRQLVTDIKELAEAINVAKQSIEKAKTNNDFEAERQATHELEELTKQKEDKMNKFSENENILSKRGYRLDEIDEAKKTKQFFEAKIGARKDNIKKLDDEGLKYKPIMDFDAIAKRGQLQADEMKKVEHIKDRDELNSMMRDAARNKDKIRFEAIGLKLAKDGNENDGVLNNMGYNSDASGLKGLIRDIADKNSKNYMGYSDQEAKAFGMKMSYAAEANNHWGTARAFTVKNGRYVENSDKDQAMAAVSEIAKMDPQAIARSLNRLGYGGETPDGNFVLNNFGLALLKTVGPSLAQQMTRFNPNARPRLATKENIELMIKVGVAPEFISGLTGKTNEKGKSMSPTIKAPDAVNAVFK